MKKNIIFVWVQNPLHAKENEYWGIGDVIYGILCSNYICEKLNYNFYIDFSKHPISKYLVKNEHPFQQQVNEQKRINMCWYLEDKLKNTNSNLTMIFCVGCNTIKKNDRELFLNKYVTKNIIDYLNKILIPNEEVTKLIDEHRMKLKIQEKYNIFHFRLGDNELVKKNKENDKKKKKRIN